MKVKLYVLAIMLFVCAKSFATITTQILSPTKNFVDTGILKISVNVTSTYDVSTITAQVLNLQTNLTYNTTTKHFTGTLNLTGFPQDLLTLKVLVTDLAGNKDSSSVNFYYDHAPKLTVSWPEPTAYPFATQPYIHIRAACQADSGHCTVKILDRSTGNVLATGLTSIDTVIDVSAIAVPGFFGTVSGTKKNNYFTIVATDRRNVTDTKLTDYVFEPSPYIEKYIDGFKRPKVSFTELDSLYYDEFNNYLFHYLEENRSGKKDTIYPNYDDYEFKYMTPIPTLKDFSVMHNDHYVFYQSKYQYFGYRSLTGGSDRVEDHPFITRGPVADIMNPDDMDVDTSGHGAAGNKITINGNRATYISDKTNLHYYDGVTDNIIVSDFLYKKVTTNDRFAKAKVNGGYVAYYKAGTTGTRAIWLWDSTLTTRRISIISDETFLFSVNPEGDVMYGRANGGADNYNTYWGDRQAHNTLVANFGDYFEFNKLRLLETVIGCYKINLTIAPDSLAPIRKEVKKDSAYSFTTRDFDNAFKGPGYVYKVKITALPKYGTLLLNGKAIKVDSVIAHALLPNLSYKPNKGYSGKDTMQWTAYNGAEFVANDTIIELNVVTSLPVQLVNFTGTALGKANQLNWQTAQEVNSSYFGVEKSTDGIHFTTMGNVAARGNSSITESYEYLDAAPQTGLNYYRLKIVDKDASFGYSQTISIRNTGSYITLAYPNPAKSFVNLSFTAARSGKYSFTVYSASGKAVSTNKYTVNTGNQNITLPLAGMASGTYIVKVVDNEGNAVTQQKVVKQ